MTTPYLDLTGGKFGRLTVLRLERCPHSNAIMWRCQCSCGSTSRVSGSSLKRGKSRSCGCLGNETRKVANQLRGSVGYDV